MKYKYISFILFMVIGFLFGSCQNDKPVEAKEAVWIINTMELNDNHKISQYYQSLQANWAKPREAGIQQGFIEDYEILSVPKGDSWEFLLMTKYSNQEQVDSFKSKYSMLLAQVNPEGVVLIDGYSPRDFATQTKAKIISDEEFRQLISTVNTGV